MLPGQCPPDIHYYPQSKAYMAMHLRKTKNRFSCDTILACVNVVKVELVPNLAGFRDCQVLLIGYLFAEAEGGSEQ